MCLGGSHCATLAIWAVEPGRRRASISARRPQVSLRKTMRKSELLFSLAKRYPNLSRRLLRAWVPNYVHFPREPHWTVVRLMRDLDCRIPVNARLGNGMKMKVFWDDNLGRDILEKGYFERATVALMQGLLKPGMAFFDVGAHIGQYTLLAAGLVGETGEVHSFEPNPETFTYLEANVRRNRLHNVRLNALALTDHEGEQTLYLGNLLTSLQKMPESSERTAVVRLSTLDAYLAATHSMPDMVKVDVEGAELAFLQGASTLFSCEHQPIMLVEFAEERQIAFGFSTRELARYLSERGYLLFKIQGDSHSRISREEVSFNVLALPRQRQEEFDDLLKHESIVREPL